MKIYFSGSISGKKQYLDYYKLIINTLINLGHTVISDYLFKTTEEEVLKQTIDEHIKTHQFLAKSKIESDLVVAELSYRSFGQGQEIAHAFRVGKPVLGLYLKNKRPHLILNDAGDKLLLAEYDNESLKDVIEQGIDYPSQGFEKRFTMIFPSIIVDYLDTVSRDKNISRSEYIRALIEKEMETKK